MSIAIVIAVYATVALATAYVAGRLDVDELALAPLSLLWPILLPIVGILTLLTAIYDLGRKGK